MKKLNYLLLFLLLMIPVVVKADMGPPTVNFPVRISNPNGAELVNTEDHNDKISLPMNTILTVVGLNNGEANKDFFDVLYNDKYYSINSKNVEGAKDKIKLEDYKLSKTISYTSFCSDSYLYNGPSTIYGKVSDTYKVPEDKTFEIKYADEFFGYVEIDGYKGWIILPNNYGDGLLGKSCLMAKYTNTSSSNEFITVSDIKFNTNKDFRNGSANATIPKNSKVTMLYTYDDDPHSYEGYVDYNGTKGWIHNDGFVFKSFLNDEEVIVFKDVAIYDTPSSSSTKLITVPKYTKLKVISITGYQGDVYHEVEYKGKTGWLIDGYSTIEYGESFVVQDAVQYFDYPDGKSKGYLEPTRKIDIFYDTLKTGEWVYFTADNLSGWFKYDGVSVISSSDNEKKNKAKSNANSTVNTDIIIKNRDTKKLKEKRQNRLTEVVSSPEDDEKNTILYVVIGLGLVVISAVATFILINNKKKSKKKVITTGLDQKDNNLDKTMVIGEIVSNTVNDKEDKKTDK